jgi:hypothetical protein
MSAETKTQSLNTSDSQTSYCGFTQLSNIPTPQLRICKFAQNHIHTKCGFNFCVSQFNNGTF